MCSSATTISNLSLKKILNLSKWRNNEKGTFTEVYRQTDQPNSSHLCSSTSPTLPVCHRFGEFEMLENFKLLWHNVAEEPCHLSNVWTINFSTVWWWTLIRSREVYLDHLRIRWMISLGWRQWWLIEIFKKFLSFFCRQIERRKWFHCYIQSTKFSTFVSIFFN